MRAGKGYWQQVSRRRILRGAALSGAAVAATSLMGCREREQGGAPTGAPSGKEPRRGGILNRASGPPGSYDTQGVVFDPHVNIHAAARSFRLFYQGVLAYDLRTYEVIPELAQKWEQPSDTEYIFTLQPNVKWHNKPPVNGRALTVEDVVFSLERARTNDPRILTRSLLDAVDKIEAVDSTRFRLTTKAPYAPMLSNLSNNQLLILAPEVLQRAPKFSTAEDVIGTGAFIMQSIEENVGGRYVRNPDYWKPGLPYLDEVRTRYFSDEQAAWAAFLGGQLHITRVPGTEAKKYVAQQGPGYEAPWFNNDTSVQAVANTRMKPVDDPRVWRALRLLHDHEEMITAWAEVQFGRGRNGSIFTTAMESWDLTHEEYYQYLEWKQPKDDAAREAIALLNAAGFNRDNPLRFELGGLQSPTTLRIMELLQAQWKKFSQGIVDVQLRQYDPPSLNAIQANKSFTYLITGRSGGTDDPDSTFSLLHRTGGSRNYGSYSDPTLDAMIDKQRAELNRERRKALVREILLYMIDHAPDTIPANYYVLCGVKPQVQGFAPENFLNGRQYESIWLSA